MSIADDSPAEADRPPLYLQLVKDLMQDIAGGKVKPGECLPGEIALGQRHGVSRHTVRAALERLRELGLVQRRPGVGTIVADRPSAAPYVHSVSSIGEILQYTVETQLQPLRAELLASRGALARELQCRSGQRWLYVACLRTIGLEAPPLGWTDLYIVPAYQDVRDHLGRSAKPVYALLEELYGERITEIRQEISVAEIPEGKAELLQVPAGSPALRIVRRYLGAKKRVIEIAVSLHPKDRFTYSMRLERRPEER